MKFLDLFCGIGGFRLGMESVGHECVGACEIDEYARAVYLKNFPTTKWFPDDITELNPNDLPSADCWCAGFPCQDISDAGKKAGITGSKSSLFFEITRLASVVRPRFIFLENVPALLRRGMGNVLGELCRIGYDAEWEVLSARSVGAPHTRKRVWIVAYPQGQRRVSGSLEHKENSVNQGFAEAGRILGQINLFVTDFKKGSYPDSRNLRADDGVSGWLDEPKRVQVLGNAVVPQVVEIIARRLQ